MLTINVGGGPIMLPGGIHFDGGAGGYGATRQDTLNVVGDPESNAATLRPDELAINGLSIHYSQLEFIDLTLGSGDDTVAIEGSDARTTLRDTGGIDTLDFSSASSGIRLHLRLDAGQLQATGVARLGLDGTFENVIGTPLADRIFGSLADNLLVGGGGDDSLDGFAGNNVLSGGDGNDTLLGGRHDDVLIGGRGRDRLLGLTGSDLLAGGYTDHDDNLAALRAIRDEWTSGNPLPVRIAHLENGGGANGLVRLKRDETVFDDGAVDVLLGGAGDDWLLSDPGDLGIG
ncbi:MAG: hypothetical protein J5I93_30420 [Pirellulaceae bacterium]|nr:hypothetical protein [Pirellulaceae bacterium]